MYPFPNAFDTCAWRNEFTKTSILSVNYIVLHSLVISLQSSVNRRLCPLVSTQCVCSALSVPAACVTCAHRAPNCHEVSHPAAYLFSIPTCFYSKLILTLGSRTTTTTKTLSKVHILATSHRQALPRRHLHRHSTSRIFASVVTTCLTWFVTRTSCDVPLCGSLTVVHLQKHCMVIIERVSRQDEHLNSLVRAVSSLSTCHNNMQYSFSELFVLEFP